MDLATAAFWLFLSVVVGSLIWRKTIVRRETFATLRVAMERGLPLDDSLVQSLLDAASDRRRARTRISSDFFLVIGVLLAATGLCLGVLALFVPEPQPFIVLALSGEILAGGAFILWRMLSRHAPASGDSAAPI
jgi:hypothetical protein